jgi:hypothetical protein
MIDSLICSAINSISSTHDEMPVDLDVRALLLRIADKLRDGSIKAVRHPVGFMLIDLSELVDDEPFHQYRLHVWSADQHRSDGLGYIHDHSWGLTSAVLLGELVDINMTASADPGGAYHFVRVTYGSMGESLEDAGRFALTVWRRRTLRAPVVYRLEAQVLHETRILSDSAVTLVIADRSKFSQYRPLVVAQDDLIVSNIGPRMVLRSDIASNAISSLID